MCLWICFVALMVMMHIKHWEPWLAKRCRCWMTLHRKKYSYLPIVKIIEGLSLLGASKVKDRNIPYFWKSLWQAFIKTLPQHSLHCPDKLRPMTGTELKGVAEKGSRPLIFCRDGGCPGIAAFLLKKCLCPHHWIFLDPPLYKAFSES